MTTGEGSWDTNLIHDLFIDRDASLILSIFLDDSEADNWYSKGEKLGVYSVKSAYLMLQEESRTKQGGDNLGF